LERPVHAPSRSGWPIEVSLDGFHRQVVEDLEVGIYYVDRDRTIRYWSPGATRISGYEPADVVGSHCFDNLLNHVDEAGRLLCFEGCPLAGVIDDGQPRAVRVFLRHRDGHRVPVEVRATAIRDEAGQIVGAAELFSPVRSTRPESYEAGELWRLAFLDELTGLPNRRQAERVLAARLESLARHAWPFGLLVADLDGLKQVNDRYGHAAGDVALRVVARTLANARAEDLVARWGGDEFVVVVEAAELSGLASAAARIGALVARSRAHHAGADLPLALSIGAAVARRGDTVASLFGRADQALYRAKTAGRNQCCLWEAPASPRLLSEARPRRGGRLPGAAVRRRSA
jgi:diguanylate cyclase (GGDEF)-like protein/PAS domain S-box-containing protein